MQKFENPVKGQNVAVAVEAFPGGKRVVLEVQSDEFISPATFANVLYDVVNTMPKRFKPHAWGDAEGAAEQVKANALNPEQGVQSTTMNQKEPTNG